MGSTEQTAALRSNAYCTGGQRIAAHALAYRGRPKIHTAI
jgi:hypothetical protein